ncbi:dihydroxyacetone kinase subunit DhaK [Bacillus sp. es.034]|uniref:dihydroxyacetone kinase subunit DhaK n=1 Tax=Bacillus sp. es.034 TaxID=1761763 RepID=UPI000C004D83|nr:dihydroxyacetone kinase subunit DhaK [Bacillus sp. es.034]PFG03355.1 dihydroxyacetone kinase DhaK subunit [Bacillus sp. es.034]
MKKIINENENIITEMLEGFLYAHGNVYKKLETTNGIVIRDRKDKVGILIGGGSGHEPLFIGFVGEGLADGAAVGNVFAAPPPYNVLEVTKAIDSGKGVLHVYGNYAGDILNFDMAAELAEMEGIECKTVIVRDDVASAPLKRYEDRRGIAGDVFVIKIAGAASDQGLSLEEVARVTQKAADHTRSIGVALTPGMIPGLEKPTFSLAEDEIEFGMGIHGEPGIERTKMMKADDLTDRMLDSLFKDFDYKKGHEVCVLVNGLGSTTQLELMIVNRRVNQVLKDKGIVIHHNDVNSYCTSQEMGGVSISLLLLDNELKKYYDQPAYSPYFTKK